ncbi:MAG: radical SAM protein [Gemmatimonadota bacterium]|nr:radical SAM protein [Gemmatimonadota bacterium]
MTASQTSLHLDVASRSLPVLGQQRDITYHATEPKRILNGPETTGMGFWSINPYVGCAFGCTYCYARYAHRYVMERAASAPDQAGRRDPGVPALAPWLAFERQIIVKEHAAVALRRSLRQRCASPLGPGDTIVIGTATDPYQPAERRFRVTRGILEVLGEHPGLDIVIITKSPLITRDIDVLAAISRGARLSVHLSLITLDRELARRIEPRAPTPEARLRALQRLRAAGIDAGVNCMPVLPGITDRPRDLDALVQRVAAAGATYVGACALRLRHTARERYLPWVAEEFPHLAERYRRAYARGHQPSDEYRQRLASLVRHLCERHGVRYGSYEPEDEREAPTGVMASGPEQLALGL